MPPFDDIALPFPSGIRLTIKAKPGSNRIRDARIVEIGDGRRAVEIAVAAAPEDGKANKAILERLANELGLKKAQLSVKTGHAARLKVIEIVGETEALAQKVGLWLASL